MVRQSILNLVILLAVLLLAAGCEPRDSEKPRAQGRQTVTAVEAARPVLSLFEEPVIPRHFELPSQALAAWREYRNEKPALVLMADQPYLVSPPPNVARNALDLLLTGSDAELMRRGDYAQPDPLILAPQTVFMALQADLLSEVYWILPDDRGLDEFSWQVIEEQLRREGWLPEQGALTIGEEDGGRAWFSFRGKRITLVHPDGIKGLRIERPAIFHLDLGYFKQAYRSEARIPIMLLARTLANMLKIADLDVYAATLSYSTLDGYVSLEGRFTLKIFSAYLQNPGLLGETMPALWQLRDKALQAQTMFQEQRLNRLAEKMLEVAPEDPGALYFAARRLFYQHQFHAGLRLLDAAVAADGGYATAYIELSDKAMRAGDIEDALMLMERAAGELDRNPEWLWRKAVLLRMAGREAEAVDLVNKLQRLRWSPDYHADVPGMLEAFLRQEHQPDKG